MTATTCLVRNLDRRTHNENFRNPARRRLALPWLLAIREAPCSIAVPNIRRDIQVKLASTRLEWEDALELVEGNYQTRGYTAGSESAVRFTPYHALPDTVVLIAKERNRVVATFSLVADNALLGLPCESLYRAEMQQLRQENRRLFETTCLADRDLGLRDFMQVFMTMIQLGWQYALGQGAATNVITVNPRHRDFYTRMLGYAPLGPRRSYALVQGHPAEAYYLDPETMRGKSPKLFERLFGVRLPLSTLQRPMMVPALLQRVARRSSLVTPQVVAEIHKCVEAGGSPRRW